MIFSQNIVFNILFKLLRAGCETDRDAGDEGTMGGWDGAVLSVF